MPFIQSGGQTIVEVPAGQKILITSYGAGQTKVSIGTNPSQFPESFIDTVVIENNSWLSPVFSSLQEVKIDAAVCEVEYVIGVSPIATKERYQPTAVAINGGEINGTTIGLTTPSSGSFTTIGVGADAVSPLTVRRASGAISALQGVTSASSTLSGYLAFQNAFVTTADGTALARVGFGTAANTGAGFLSFETSSGSSSPAERMRIDSAGNVGIGAAPNAWAPSSKALQIVGATPSQSVSITNDGGFFLNGYYDGTSYRYVGSGVSRLFSLASGHRFYSASSGTAGGNATYNQLMALDDTGNLGIGVTPSAGWHSGTKAIQVGTFGAVSCIISTGYTELLNNCYNTTTSSFAYSTSNAATRYSQQLGAHVWYSAPVGTAGSTSAFTQAMALLANNNLLLGTTSDSGYRFTLNGNGTYFTDATYSGIIGKASVVQGSAAITPTADFAVRSDSNLIIFAGGGTERSRVTTAGNQIDYQPAESAQNTSATLTIAQLQSRIITSNAAVTLTLPTGTALEGYTNAMAVNTSFEVVFIATTANAITIAANGNTTIGNLTVSGNTSGVFRFRKTATNSFTVYRIS